METGWASYLSDWIFEPFGGGCLYHGLTTMKRSMKWLASVIMTLSPADVPEYGSWAAAESYASGCSARSADLWN